MNDKDIQEQPALIGALAEDAQAGFEAMSVPFLVYGIAIPFGTVATYLFVHFGLAKFVWSIWFAVIGFCQLFLPLYFRRKRKVKIQRASDRIFTALWGSIGFIIALDFVLAFMRRILSFCKTIYGTSYYQCGDICAAVNSGFCRLTYHTKQEELWPEIVLTRLSIIDCLTNSCHLV